MIMTCFIAAPHKKLPSVPAGYMKVRIVGEKARAKHLQWHSVDSRGLFTGAKGLCCRFQSIDYPRIDYLIEYFLISNLKPTKTKVSFSMIFLSNRFVITEDNEYCFSPMYVLC